ncbi:MAG: type II toxin-antitoxin system RelE/ParE family toxin [Bifidobacteriaceae bacterium]|jgi:plasmid stabilization system protein ParE|nr:type II toxin-antitoxin system RelE/ParE family toxin [Bifidobacteriaceae bacterium]
MTVPQREHPEAVAEFDAAVRWYESQQPGVGLVLVDRAGQARQEIADWPSGARQFEPELERQSTDAVIRSKAVRGYPYRIIYTMDDGVIVILAYAHAKRRPGYWMSRLDS